MKGADFMSEQENILKLKAMIEASDNIVFFGGAGVSTESGIRISEVRQVSIIPFTNTAVHRNRFFLIHFL